MLSSAGEFRHDLPRGGDAGLRVLSPANAVSIVVPELRGILAAVVAGAGISALPRYLADPALVEGSSLCAGGVSACVDDRESGLGECTHGRVALSRVADDPGDRVERKDFIAGGCAEHGRGLPVYHSLDEIPGAAGSR